MKESIFIRRSEAMDITGFTESEFSKLVNAETITPVYLVWQVRDKRDAIVQETTEAKARLEAARIGGRVLPAGRAWFKRDQILALAPTTASK